MLWQVLVVSKDIRDAQVLCDSLKLEPPYMGTAAAWQGATELLEQCSVLIVDGRHSLKEQLPACRIARAKYGHYMVIVTRLGDMESEALAIRHGTDDLLSTPFSRPRLLLTLGNALRLRTMSHALAYSSAPIAAVG